jgi:hypothetical protein
MEHRRDTESGGQSAYQLADDKGLLPAFDGTSIVDMF